MTTAMAEQHLSETLRREYHALSQGAALQIRDDTGVIKLTDTDRADFLHRMTTNDINKLPAGKSTVTILTSPTARSLFAFTVVNRGEDLLLLPAPGRATALAHHLHGQIFFMDAVKVTNISADYLRMRLMGPNAHPILRGLGFDELSDATDVVVDRDGIIAVGEHRYDLPGIELIVPVERAEAFSAELVDAGALRLTGEAAYTVRRIELGRPRPGAEIVESYNPLESGMGWVCNDSKGCYTGQEILARQVTYDKVTKTLVGLLSQSAVAAGSTVMHDGKRVGTVTSAAFSVELERHIALAVVSRPHNQEGTAVHVTQTDTDNDAVDAVVAALPLLPEAEAAFQPAD